MTDQELLQAIGQVVEAKLEPVRQDIRELKEDVQRLETRMGKLETRTDKLEEQVQGIRVYLDVDQRRTLNLLLEGQKALWDRFVPHEKFDPLEDRTEVLEATVKRHSQEIRELQPA